MEFVEIPLVETRGDSVKTILRKNVGIAWKRGWKEPRMTQRGEAAPKGKRHSNAGSPIFDARKRDLGPASTRAALLLPGDSSCDRGSKMTEQGF